MKIVEKRRTLFQTEELKSAHLALCKKKKNSAINQSVNQSFDLSINRSVGHLLTYTAVSRPVRFVSPRAVALFYNAYDLANYFWEVDDVEHFLCVLN